MQELTTLGTNYNGRGMVNPTVQIVKLVLFETGTYAQQWRRPYETEMTGSTVSLFQEQLEGHTTGYRPADFGGIAQNFLKPSANPEAPVNITNGWGVRHCRFIMVVEYDEAIGSRMQSIITGYTEHAEGAVGMGGMSVAGAPGSLSVDQNLVFTINSVIATRRQMEYGPNGQRELVQVADNSHLLADEKFDSMYAPNVQEKMRPTDVFATMMRAPMAKVSNERIWDQRTAMVKQAAKSRRSNVIPANFISNVLDNYNNAVIDPSVTAQGDGTVFGQARALAKEAMVNRDTVLKMLADIRCEPIGPNFTFRDLLRLDPTIQNRVVGRVSGRTDRMALHEADQTNPWDGSDGITLAATIISQCVPGIMADLALMRVGFRMHNLFAVSGNYSTFDPTTHRSNPNNLPEFVYENIRGLGDQDLAPAAMQFEQRFWYEVMKDLTYGNQVPFSLRVDSDLLGETVVTISLDNCPERQYVTPSFADALLTPLVTGDLERPIRVADDFNTLMQAVVHQPQIQNILTPQSGGGRPKF